MAAKGKKVLLQNLNTFVLDTILTSKECTAKKGSVEKEIEAPEIERNVIVSQIRKQWESPEFQRKLANEVFEIKGKTLTPGPKRNKSAYMFFCQDMRAKIVEDNDNCKPHQIMSLLGSKWRELTTKQKSKYYEQAAEDKERYLDMKEIEKRRNKTPSKLSAYFLFCEDERPKVKKDHPTFSTKEVTSECGKRWNELKLNDQEKYTHYVEKAAK
jgi:hypothetical protein